MKLIIDIDEDLKSAIYNCGLFLNPTDKITLINAINNGTPLPKNHGDLIDRDELLADSYPIDDWNGNEVNIVDVMTVEMADAIIKSDKGDME